MKIGSRVLCKSFYERVVNTRKSFITLLSLSPRRRGKTTSRWQGGRVRVWVWLCIYGCLASRSSCRSVCGCGCGHQGSVHVLPSQQQPPPHLHAQRLHRSNSLIIIITFNSLRRSSSLSEVSPI
jgi:hypothetical protein